jgi:hypothetical protein
MAVLSRFKKRTNAIVNVKGEERPGSSKAGILRILVRTSLSLLLEPKDQGVVAIATHLQR